MAKGNVKTIRLSDELLEIIESQAGDNFTAKFEALVTRCMWELPKKEQELASIQERINDKHDQLRKLDEKIIRMENNIRTTNYAAEQYEYQLRASRKLLEDLCKTD